MFGGFQKGAVPFGVVLTRRGTTLGGVQEVGAHL